MERINVSHIKSTQVWRRPFCVLSSVLCVLEGGGYTRQVKGNVSITGMDGKLLKRVPRCALLPVCFFLCLSLSVWPRCAQEPSHLHACGHGFRGQV